VSSFTRNDELFHRRLNRDGDWVFRAHMRIRLTGTNRMGGTRAELNLLLVKIGPPLGGAHATVGKRAISPAEWNLAKTWRLH
jgi:hypothetical protein